MHEKAANRYLFFVIRHLGNTFIMHKRNFFKSLGIGCVLVCASMGAWAASPLPVVASFSILGDVAREVGGERVAVQTVVGPNTDIHGYQLTPADIRKIRSAKALLINGLELESAALQRAFRDSKIPVTEAAKGIEPIKSHDHDHEHHGHSHAHGHGHDHAHGEFDPHIWQDPVRMQTYARNVANALVAADPAGKAYYEGRLQTYQQALKQLDTWAQQQFAGIAPAQRKVLTAHDAFAYLGKRYQIGFIAPLGTSSDSQPSARALALIIQQVRAEKVRAIFLENVKDARLIQQLARETGVAVNRQPLYSDALSPASGPAGTYLQLMRHNIGAIAQALRQNTAAQ